MRDDSKRERERKVTRRLKKEKKRNVFGEEEKNSCPEEKQESR